VRSFSTGSLRAGMRWIDIGCGNGASRICWCGDVRTAEVQGIDPSDGQLAYARNRPASARGPASSGRRHGAAVSHAGGRSRGHGAVSLRFLSALSGVAEMVASWAGRHRRDLHMGHGWAGGFPIAPAISSRCAAMGLFAAPRHDLAASQIEMLRE